MSKTAQKHDNGYGTQIYLCSRVEGSDLVPKAYVCHGCKKPKVAMREPNDPVMPTHCVRCRG